MRTINADSAPTPFKRVVIKTGTSVLLRSLLASNHDVPVRMPLSLAGTPLGAVIEQIAELRSRGTEVIFVCSGAVGFGTTAARRRGVDNNGLQSPEEEPTPTCEPNDARDDLAVACLAAAGQAALTDLVVKHCYSCGVTPAEVLVTQDNLDSRDTTQAFSSHLLGLLKRGVMPVVNENDAVSRAWGKMATVKTAMLCPATPTSAGGKLDPQFSCTDGLPPFKDNDGLAAIVAVATEADGLLLLTDVDGLYDRSPLDPMARLIPEFDVMPSNAQCPGGAGSHSSTPTPSFSAANGCGRGGMQSKVAAARCAVLSGCVERAFIASGFRDRIVVDILLSGCGTVGGGTVFRLAEPSEKEEKQTSRNRSPQDCRMTDVASSSATRSMADASQAVRAASQQLRNVSAETRTLILQSVASDLEASQDAILHANAEDVAAARRSGLAEPLLYRLGLNAAKLDSVVTGIRRLTTLSDPVGEVLQRTEVTPGVLLTKQRTPIGVILVIFESRPDCLPQLAALGLRSGNGLLLKGGKEAERTNKLLHEVITRAVDRASGNAVSPDVITLVPTRSCVDSLLALNNTIDLVIPRGSKSLVRHIQNNTRIPVLGHADGVCHTFVHASADVSVATDIVLDAKTQYPAACNATETLLLDERLVLDDRAGRILDALTTAGVELFGGPRAISTGLIRLEQKAAALNVEHGRLAITVEVVTGVDEAVEFVNKYGSHHTDCIIATCDRAAEAFVQRVDSACVFHNCSTRMADGYRFGLGAEVGISTGRIHARGPVGVTGLMTERWVMCSQAATLAGGVEHVPVTAAAFADGRLQFTHLPLNNHSQMTG